MQNEVCLGENVAKENRKWHLQLGWLGAKELLFRKCILMLTYCFNNKFKNQNNKKKVPEKICYESKQTFLPRGLDIRLCFSFRLCSLWCEAGLQEDLGSWLSDPESCGLLFSYKVWQETLHENGGSVEEGPRSFHGLCLYLSRYIPKYESAAVGW